MITKVTEKGKKLAYYFSTIYMHNEIDFFKKWKWDALIFSIETEQIDLDYLFTNNYITKEEYQSYRG